MTNQFETDRQNIRRWILANADRETVTAPEIHRCCDRELGGKIYLVDCMYALIALEHDGLAQRQEHFGEDLDAIMYEGRQAEKIKDCPFRISERI